MSVENLPLLATRGSDGIKLFHNADSFKQQEELFGDAEAKGKVMEFSEDGKFFGYCGGQTLKVLDMSDGSTIFETPKQKTLHIKFSPNSTYMACWEPFFTSPQYPQGFNNYEIFNLQTEECVKSVMHKNQFAWEPRWTADEKLCARCVSNEVQFHADGNFGTTTEKLHLQGIDNFTLSPTPKPPYMVAAYVPGKKGAPSSVRLFQYPNFGSGQAITNKSFFKADKVKMIWNRKGTAVLILVSAEMDTTGKTYYGEQSLHFMTTRGESSLVPFDKKGPIYSVEWNPDSSHFCVVYGYMPAKATLFNMKAEPIFDFGTGPRSVCSFNAFGNILCIAGFGNLPGDMEMWNVQTKKLICKPQARDTTYFEWCPDGQHILTATCAPRLRVGNGFKIWHYTGNVISKYDVKPNGELLEAIWQHQPAENFPVPKVADTGYTEVKKQAYRPPSARGMPEKKLVLHEKELPQNQRNQQNMSASALKNKKKRDAKARAKQSETPEAPSSPPPSSQTSTGQDAIADADAEKKIRGIKKKLRQIDDLKAKQKEGKQLEKNQLDKLTTEKELLSQLAQLQAS